MWHWGTPLGTGAWREHHERMKDFGGHFLRVRVTFAGLAPLSSVLGCRPALLPPGLRSYEAPSPLGVSGFLLCQVRELGPDCVRGSFQPQSL